MKGRTLVGGVLALATPGYAIAQDVAPVTSAPSTISISVEVEVTQALTSKTSKPGDGFDLRVAEPVVVDDVVMIPAGVVGRGEVVHAARAGWAGKAGELILAARYLSCGDEQVPLGRLRFGAAGKSRVGSAFTASMLVPFAGVLIVGGEVTVAPGTKGNARIAGNIAIPAACRAVSTRGDNR